MRRRSGSLKRRSRSKPRRMLRKRRRGRNSKLRKKRRRRKSRSRRLKSQRRKRRSGNNKKRGNAFAKTKRIKNGYARMPMRRRDYGKKRSA
jgi:hypothetical protein